MEGSGIRRWKSVRVKADIGSKRQEGKKRMVHGLGVCGDPEPFCVAAVFSESCETRSKRSGDRDSAPWTLHARLRIGDLILRPAKTWGTVSVGESDHSGRI